MEKVSPRTPFQKLLDDPWDNWGGIAMKKLLFLILVCAWVVGCSDVNPVESTDILKQTLSVLSIKKPFVWLHYVDSAENGNNLLDKAEGMEIYKEEKYLENFLNYEYLPVEIEKVPDTKSIWLCSDEFTIYGYEGSDILQLNANGELYQFQAISEDRNVSVFGDNLKQWLDAVNSEE